MKKLKKIGVGLNNSFGPKRLKNTLECNLHCRKLISNKMPKNTV